MGLFLFIFCFHPFSEVAHAALSEAFAHSKEWKALLHYKKGILGSEASEVSGRSFFFAPNGSIDPLAELEATKSALMRPLEKGQDENDHPVCTFRARLHLLLAHGLVDAQKIPKLTCPNYHVYQTRIQTKKLSVVFSSYYLGSASSIFGHSFLKFSGENENELFDTGINFSANPTTQNPILYAIYGLIGVFPASFSAQPFYYKVREYNDFESRDLWTYELNLSQPERDFLLEHLWELGNTTFRYFYFNENCSYHILRAIEAAVPRVQFFARRPVYLIPSESIHVLYHPVSGQTDLVKSVHYRPSLRNVAYSRYAGLNEHDRKLVLHALSTHSASEMKSADHEANGLDTLIDAVDLKDAEKIIANDPVAVAWKQSVLQARADFAEVSVTPKLPTPELENPALGHGTRRLAFSYGVDRPAGVSEPFIDLQVRASHHDLLDPSVGYPPNLHIDFGRAEIRYFTQQKNVVLQELTVVDLTALAVEHPLFKHISYDTLITYDRTPNADCADQVSCGALRVRGGVGRSYSLFPHQVIFFLLNGEPSYGFHYLQSHLDFALSPSVSSLIEFTPRLKSLLSANIEHRFIAHHHFSSEEAVEVRYGFNDEFGVGAKADFYQQSEFSRPEFLIKGFYYF